MTFTSRGAHLHTLASSYPPAAAAAAWALSQPAELAARGAEWPQPPPAAADVPASAPPHPLPSCCSADAGASLTYPQQAGTVRKNAYIVIKNRPCKVRPAGAQLEGPRAAGCLCSHPPLHPPPAILAPAAYLPF